MILLMLFDFEKIVSQVRGMDVGYPKGYSCKGWGEGGVGKFPGNLDRDGE